MLSLVLGALSIAMSSSTTIFDPDTNTLPLRKDLPSIDGAPAGAAWFWGQQDEVRVVQSS